MTDKRKNSRRVFLAVFVLSATITGTAAMSQANCWCVDGYMVCDDDQPSYSYEPPQEYYAAPETETETPGWNGDSYVTDTEPVQPAQTWDEPPPRQYQASSLSFSLPDIPLELVLGIFAVIGLAILAAAIDHFNRIILARKTAAALDGAAAAKAARRNVEDAMAEADKIIAVFLAEQGLRQLTGKERHHD